MEPKRSKICLICSGTAESFHLNYGAATCLSCRAFFRRTVQNRKQLRCKGDGIVPCVVLLESRKKCQSCRYDKCLKVGMRPDCVLDEDAKMQRFRKMIKKQKKTGTEKKLTFPKRRKTTEERKRQDSTGSQIDLGECVTQSVQTQAYPSYVDSSEYVRNAYFDSQRHEGWDRVFGRRYSDSNPDESEVVSASSLQWLIENGYSTLVTQRPGQQFEQNYVEETPPSSSMHSSDVSNEENFVEIYENEPEKNSCQESKQLPEEIPSTSDVKELEKPTPISMPVKKRLLLTAAKTMKNAKKQRVEYESEEDDSSDEEQFEMPSTALTKFPLAKITGADLANVVSPYLDWQNEGRDNIYCPRYKANDSKFRHRMRKYVRHLESTWDLALEKVRHDDDEDWLDSLVCFHLGLYAPMDRGDLKMYLIRLARIFKLFALQQPEFVALSKDDQRRLLNCNAPVFIQYVLTRYFQAETPQEQMKFLTLDSHLDEKTKDMMLNRMSLDIFAKRIKLFSEESDKARFHYEDLLSEMSDCSIRFTVTPLIALGCIYHTKGISMLEDFLTIDGHYVNIMILADWSDEVYLTDSGAKRLSPWLEKCKEMSQVFEDNIQWFHEEDTNFKVALSHVMNVSFANESSFWLQQELKKFSRAYSSFSLGEKTFRKYDSFVRDKYLPPDFGAMIFNLFQRRFGIILNVHEEFRQLSDIDQGNILDKNFMTAIALHVARNDMQKDGGHQLMQVQGDCDQTHVKSILSNLKNDNYRKMPAVNTRAVNDGCHLLTKAEVLETESLTRKLDNSVGHSSDYQLLTLIVLTNCPQLAKLNKWYTGIYLQKEPSENFVTKAEELHFVMKSINTLENIISKFLENSHLV